MTKKYIKSLKEVADKGIKIRCTFCDLKKTCSRREQKERYEESDIVTYCILTPNSRKKTNN